MKRLMVIGVLLASATFTGYSVAPPPQVPLCNCIGIGANGGPQNERSVTGSSSNLKNAGSIKGSHELFIDVMIKLRQFMLLTVKI